MANNLQRVSGTLKEVKTFVNNKETQKRFNEVLGDKAPQFMASVVNVVSSNTSLQKCSAASIMSAALVAATYDMPIDNNLGFSAIVPYKDKAQYQIMTKGFIQLAIRSGQYEEMNYSEVYEDELLSYNPITGRMQFVSDFSNCSQRAAGETNKIIGYYAWFKLKTGFSHELYMSRAEVENHARKYSQAYKYDIRYGKKSSVWSTDFDSMAKKTVIKLLLNKWGILSVDIQRAIQDDQKVYQKDGTGIYADNMADDGKENIIDISSQIIDEPEAEPVVDVFSDQQQTEPEQTQPKAVDNIEKQTKVEELKPEQVEPEQTAVSYEDDFAAFDSRFDNDEILPFA